MKKILLLAVMLTPLLMLGGIATASSDSDEELNAEVDYVGKQPVESLVTNELNQENKVKHKLQERTPLSLIHADKAPLEKDQKGNPLTGKGVKVAVIDTGIDAEHPAFNGKIEKAVSMDGLTNTANDLIGHGTHVSGIVH